MIEPTPTRATPTRVPPAEAAEIAPTPWVAGAPPMPEESLGPAVVATVAVFLPFCVALYAVLSTGDVLDSTSKYVIINGGVGLYGLALVRLGWLLSQRPTTVSAGSALFASAGVLGALMASSTWFSPVNVALYVVLATALAAGGLVAVGAGFHARLWRAELRSIVPLVAAVVLLALAARGRIIGREKMAVLDAVIGILACGVFLGRPAATDPGGRLALALAVPLGALLVRPFWSIRIIELSTLVISVTWALRALRPRLHDGTTGLLALPLLAVPLLVLEGGHHTRPLGMLLGLGAMLLLTRDVERDPTVGPLDFWSPPLLAATLWIVLSGSLAYDLHLLQPLRAAADPHGDLLPWLSALAVPLAVPPLLLARRRRRLAAVAVDREAPSPGLVAEVTGWVLLGLVTLTAIVACLDGGGPSPAVIHWIVPATAAAAALTGAVFAYLDPSWHRRLPAHALLVASVWVAARWQGSPRTLLAPTVVALLLSLSPLVGARRVAGAFGLGVFPLLVTDALVRGASVPLVALLLAIFGLVQLVWPPLASFAATRPVGGLALAAAAWLLVSQSLDRAAGGAPTRSWLTDPLPAIGFALAVLSIPLLWLAHRRRRVEVEGTAVDPEMPLEQVEVRDPGIVLETTAWVLLAHGAALALESAPGLRWPSVVTLAAVTAVAAVWARLVRTPLRQGAAHLLLLLTLWTLGVSSGQSWAWLAASTIACALAFTALPTLGAHRAAGWVGLLLFPAAIVEALLRGAPRLPGAILLAAFGLLHVLRRPLAPWSWPAAFGPAALLAAGWLLLFGGALGGRPLLPLEWLPAAAALALLPFALWAALPAGGGPLLVIIELLLGSTALVVFFQEPLALAPLVVLLATGLRAPQAIPTPGLLVALAGTTPALLMSAAAVAAYGTGRLSVSAAAVALALGGGLLLRPLPIEVERLRSLGVLSLVAAPLVLLCVPPAGGGQALIGPGHLPLAAAGAILPLAAWVLVRGRPSFVVEHTALLAGAAALFCIATSLSHPSASTPAREAALGALVALGGLMVAAHRLDPFVSPIAWGFAAAGVPVALIPMSADPFHWPVPAVGLVEVLLLGNAARRRGSPVLAGFTLWLGLLVASWTAAAIVERWLGGSALRIVPAAAMAAAGAGALAVGRGGRWLEAPSYFLMPFVNACLALTLLLAATTLFLPVTSSADVALALLASTALVGSAAYIGWRARSGWALVLAGLALSLPYLFLRTRTGWLARLDGADGLVAVAAGLLLAQLERPLRARAPAEDAPAVEAPESLPFGVRKVRLMADLVTALAVVSLFDLRGPLDALAPALACALFLWRARRGEPIHGILAMLMFSATVVMLLLDAGVTRLGLYAVPLAAGASALLHAYRQHLGSDEIVRPLPPITAAGICAYEAFFDPPSLVSPLALAGVGLALLAVWRPWRLRSHLHIGLLCLGAAVVSGLRTVSDGQVSELSSHAEQVGLRLLPLASLAASLVGWLLTGTFPRLEPADRDVRRSMVRDALAFSALTAAATVALVPGTGRLDMALALLAPVVLAAAAFRLGATDRVGWWFVVSAAAMLMPHLYLRLRTDWFAVSPRVDALLAVGAGLLVAAAEPVVRTRAARYDAEVEGPGAVAAPLDPLYLPFGVIQVRIVAAVYCVLAAVAFLDLSTPLDVLAPALATAYFLWRARGLGSPVYGVLAVLFIDTTVVLVLRNRGVTSPSAFALPLGASLALLLHVNRELLGSEEASVRALVPIGTGAACLYEAFSGSSIIPSMVLALLGVCLLLLAKVWRLRSHVAIGCGTLAAAVITLISEWNARGWTSGALAVGAATLLAPAVLLRWRS